MIDNNILEQVKGVFSNLKNRYILSVAYDKSHEKATEFKSFIDDFVSCSDKLSATYTEGEKFSFSILRNEDNTGISFKGIPNGHEFTSLLLAILNADGQGKNMPDEHISQRIMSLDGEIHLQTYISLTCTNCPEVVQSLNAMALKNAKITHEMIDGGVYPEEVERLNIQSVPCVYANGKLIHVGRGDLGKLLQQLEDKIGTTHNESNNIIEKDFDLIVVGGGPAGASSAIYSARKGLKVAVVAERVGGQVNDTTGIENITSIPHTTGTKLASDLRQHMGEYNIEIFDNRQVVDVDFAGKVKSIKVRGGEIFKAPAVVVATGASWRRLGLEGEEAYIGHGVHFCPHCDGPFYKGKDVAVIGGGNSGIEAAIDLAGICNKVTVLEFAEEMRADEVLLKKLSELPNVESFTMAQTTELLGDGTKLSGIKVKNRNSGEEQEISLQGVFVQIGLAPNTSVFDGKIELTPRKEIVIDSSNRTSTVGIYAAGDATTVPYKQITIAMGEGAKAALSAFDDRMRGVI